MEADTLELHLLLAKSARQEAYIALAAGAALKCTNAFH
jgi:hypothetical protein